MAKNNKKLQQSIIMYESYQCIKRDARVFLLKLSKLEAVRQGKFAAQKHSWVRLNSRLTYSMMNKFDTVKIAKLPE